MYLRTNNRGLGATSAGWLSAGDLYQLALSAGFPPDTAVKMAAIALRESGGNPAAFNGVPPDESYGLWQINMLGSLGDRRLKLFGLTSKAQLFDPATNARAAYLTWGGNDRNLDVAWSIVSNPTQKALYEQYLPVAMAAAGVNPTTFDASNQIQFADVPAAADSYLANLQAFDPVTIGGTMLVGLLAWALFRD